LELARAALVRSQQRLDRAEAAINDTARRIAREQAEIDRETVRSNTRLEENQ